MENKKYVFTVCYYYSQQPVPSPRLLFNGTLDDFVKYQQGEKFKMQQSKWRQDLVSLSGADTALFPDAIHVYAYPVDCDGSVLQTRECLLFMRREEERGV